MEEKMKSPKAYPNQNHSLKSKNKMLNYKPKMLHTGR